MAVFERLDWIKVLRVAVIVLVSVMLLSILYNVRQILIPFLIALIVTYILLPIVDYGEGKGLSRGQAIAATYVALLILGGLLSVYVVPILLSEINRLITNLPTYVEEIQRSLFEAEGYYSRINIPPSIRDAVEQSLETNLGRIEEHAASILSGLVTGVVGFFGGLFNLILGPVLAAYMLKDFHEAKSALERVFAPQKREQVRAFLADVDHVMSGFFHGRLIVSLIVGIVTAIMLGIIGVRFAVILGVVAGLTNLIPYFGPFIGAIPALLLAAFQSLSVLVQVGILYVVVQQLDGFVITPKIVGRRIGLHPLGVIFGVMAGGVLFGFWGLFLGVPAAALIKVCVDHLIRWIYSRPEKISEVE